jgi:hypothetical protein
MKKLLILLTLASFVIAAPFAVAQEKAKKEEPKNCCLKVDCKKMTEAKCIKAGGEVVADCKDCNVNCRTKEDCKKMTIAECKAAKGKPVKECKPPKAPKLK